MPKSEFFRHVLTLGAGTTAAQIIPVLISPVLTRLYSPSDFGVLAFFMSVTAIIGVIANGKYEFAILLPENDRTALNLLALCFILLILTVVLILIISLLAEQWLSQFFKMEDAAIFYLVPAAVLLMNLFRIQNLWFNRMNRYQVMSLSRIGQNAGIALFSILLGLAGFRHGLIWGVVAGYGVSSLGLLVMMYRQNRHRLREISIEKIGEAARENSDFPKFTIVSSLMEVASLQMPFLFFPAVFGPVVSGWFALSQRVTKMPLNFIVRAVGDVFRQKASQLYMETGSCRSLLTRTLWGLAAFSVVPFIVLVAWAPSVFAFAFGEEWRTAGQYTRILSVSFWLQFIVNPVSSVLHISGRQRLDMTIQMLNVIGVGTALAVGYLTGSIWATLYIFTGSGCLKYLLQLYKAYHHSHKPQLGTDELSTCQARADEGMRYSP